MTSEWDTYRWRPIATTNPSSGIIDEEGFFYRGCADVVRNAKSSAVAKECEMQVGAVLKCGIDISHIDTHMFCSLHKPFSESYIKLVRKHGVSTSFLRGNRNLWKTDGGACGLQPDSQAANYARAGELALEGYPLIDRNIWMDLVNHTHRFDVFSNHLKELPQGAVLGLATHPATDTPETRRISSDWQCRVADYQLFTSPKTKRLMNQLGIYSITHKDLKEIVPAK